MIHQILSRKFSKEELDIIQKNVYVDLTFPPPLAAKIFPELPQVSLLAGYTSLDSLCNTYVFGHKRERGGGSICCLSSTPLYPIHHCTELWALVPFYSYNASYFLEPKVVFYAEGFHLSRGTVKFRK